MLILLLIFNFVHHSSMNVNAVAEDLLRTDQPRTNFPQNVYPILKTALGNYEPTVKNVVRGFGEKGVAYITPQDLASDVAMSEDEYGVNIVASDVIAVNRSLPDVRLEECKHWNYPEDLPSTSVIIAFHNEGFSVLRRTVQSVIDRTPPHILHEVLLVDNFSEKEDLQQNLDSYIERWKGKVRLIRNFQREGLIRTLSKGAQEASGDVIVFLDAHCEVNVNWLPPLLAPIYRDYKIMTVPIIDNIDRRTFEYRANNKTNRGIFDWGLLYKENEVPEREANLHKYLSEPYKSPTFPGGIFAVNKRYFMEIGGYNPEIVISGGENLELSFKIWQCGGSIEWVPCSRIGHVPRSSMAYSFGDSESYRNGPLENYKIVVENWFDEEHKGYFYTREPTARSLETYMAEQISLKEKLKCKSFSWFMENVAYDVFDKFPKLPKNIHWGRVKNKGASICLMSMSRSPSSHIGISDTLCRGPERQLVFRINEAGQLGVGAYCVDGDTDGIKQDTCTPGTVDGPWSYDEEHEQLVLKERKLCLTFQYDQRSLALEPCESNNIYQQWTFKQS